MIKTVFSTIFCCFLFQALGYLGKCVNGITNCLTSKRALVPLLPGGMKLDIYNPRNSPARKDGAFQCNYFQKKCKA